MVLGSIKEIYKNFIHVEMVMEKHGSERSGVCMRVCFLPMYSGRQA